METQNIRVSQAGHVARITLDAPGRNALSIAMQTEIRTALARLAEDRSVRVLVIDGANRAFCSGAELDGMEGEAGRSMGEVVADQMDRICNPAILSNNTRALCFKTPSDKP